MDAFILSMSALVIGKLINALATQEEALLAQAVLHSPVGALSTQWYGPGELDGVTVGDVETPEGEAVAVAVAVGVTDIVGVWLTPVPVAV